MNFKKTLAGGAGGGVAGGIVLGFAGAVVVGVGLPVVGALAGATLVTGTAASILCGIGGFVGGAIAARIAAPLAFIGLTATGTIAGAAIGATIGLAGKAVDMVAIAPFKALAKVKVRLPKFSKKASVSDNTPVPAPSSQLGDKAVKGDFAQKAPKADARTSVPAPAPSRKPKL